MASASTLDLDAVRARFPALASGVALLDAPGGTQCPQSVIDAIAAYLRESNANRGGAFAASCRSDELVEEAHAAAAGFLGCEPGETIFGANMTTLNFVLTRTLGRTLAAGDEIVVTRLDHDGNIAPWLELARDLDLRVHIVEFRDDTTLDLDDLERKLSERTRVVAFPLASNAFGTTTDAVRIVELAHAARALAWADAVHYAPHRPIDVAALGVDVLLCSPYKFFGPHLGLAYGREELLRAWRPYKARPAADEPPGTRFETGTLAHELLAGFVAAVEHLREVGWGAIEAHERALGQRFLDGLPRSCTLYGLGRMDGRVPTFAFRVDGRTPREAAERLAAREIAVWDGDYYAVEGMERLGLQPEGAVRAGFVHYNTFEEVDRLLDALDGI
ncbi:MAG TPA: cysteine desulfurase-like protein [Gaiellaceae bacterium]|nr:cysteine desulfurase-like protein [Gaiellaceae bacterium]